MKKLLITLVLATSIIGCKKEVKNKDVNTVKEQVTTSKYSVNKAEKTISFTAYKTTEKKPVTGLFKKINIVKNGNANTIKESIHGTEFTIPVSSIETNDSSRNFKIQKFFFGILENSMQLKGKLVIENDNEGVIELTMNNITERLAFKYSITNNLFTLETVMNTDIWKAQKAITSLNNVCKELHKGADGISKTWNEVAIKASIRF